jgi:hypothetical protein
VSDQTTPDDAFIECEGHGRQPTALACVHLVEAEHGDTEMGYHWSRDDGEWIANCNECEGACDDQGFFPDALVEETFVIICKSCFDEIALAHGVTLPTELTQ